MYFKHLRKPSHNAAEDMSIKIAEAKQSNIISNPKQLKIGFSEHKGGDSMKQSQHMILCHDRSNSTIERRPHCEGQSNDEGNPCGMVGDTKQPLVEPKTKPNVHNAIIRGCILHGRISNFDSNSFILKVCFFQEAKKGKTYDPLFHCRKVIHETNIGISLNPVWNSSFLKHLPIRHSSSSRCNRFLQFVVYSSTDNEPTSPRIFVGQHTLRLSSSTAKGNAEWLRLYQWDGRTAIDAEIEVVTEIYWPIHK